MNYQNYIRQSLIVFNVHFSGPGRAHCVCVCVSGQKFSNEETFDLDTWQTTLCLKKLCKFVFVRTSSNLHQFW